MATVFEIDSVAYATSGDNAAVSLDSMTVKLNQPRELSFRAFGSQPAINALVELTIDGTRRFYGRIIECSVDDRTQGVYTCRAVDPIGLLKRFYFHDSNGYPSVYLPAETAAEQGARLWTAMETDLEAVGITAITGLPSDASVAQEFHDLLFLDGFSQWAQATLPGYGFVVNPDTLALTFFDVLSASAATVSVPTAVVPNLQYKETIDGRFTAVVLYGIPTQNSWFVAQALTAGWNQALESTWRQIHANAGSQADSTARDTLADVFCKWDFSPVKGSVNRTLPVSVAQKIWLNDADFVWSYVDIAQVDFANGYVWTRYPCLKTRKQTSAIRANAAIPGKAQAATDVYLIFAGTLMTENPIRYPTSGFEGGAYTKYGLQTTKIVHCKAIEEFTSARAQRIHSALCEPLIDCSLPIVGDDALWTYWNLNKRVNVSATVGPLTGLEAANMILSGMTITFGGAITTTLELTNDRGQWIGGMV